MRQLNYFCALSQEVQILIFTKLSYLDIERLKTVCKSFKKLLDGGDLQNAIENFGHFHQVLSPVMLFWSNEGLEWIGFDDASHKWSRLPSLKNLLSDIFFRRSPRQIKSKNCPTMKPFFFSTSGGLLVCGVLVTRLHCNLESIIVCNPITNCKKVLPPCNIQGNPKYLGIIYNTNANFYNIIVVEKQIYYRLKTMTILVYDSKVEKWENVKTYIPQPSSKLSSMFLCKSCAIVNDILFCLVINNNNTYCTILAYNVRRGEWLNPWDCPFPKSLRSIQHDSINPISDWAFGLQLIEYNNRMILQWKVHLERYDSMILKTFFIALKHFESGNEPEPLWCEDDEVSFIYKIYNSDEHCNLSHDVCSPCKAANENKCYISALNTVTGVARKCNMELNKELTKGSILRSIDHIYIKSNPISVSFEPSFSAAV